MLWLNLVQNVESMDAPRQPTDKGHGWGVHNRNMGEDDIGAMMVEIDRLFDFFLFIPAQA